MTCPDAFSWRNAHKTRSRSVHSLVYTWATWPIVWLASVECCVKDTVRHDGQASNGQTNVNEKNKLTVYGIARKVVPAVQRGRARIQTGSMTGQEGLKQIHMDLLCSEWVGDWHLLMSGQQDGHATHAMRNRA